MARRLQARERLPGYGHKIYKGDDPRLAPLLEVVALLPDPHGRRDVVDDLLAETGVRFTRRPNVDLGLGALTFVGDLPGDVPLFAIARIAGFAAHLIEELQERPLRYRGWPGPAPDRRRPPPSAFLGVRPARAGARSVRFVSSRAATAPMTSTAGESTGVVASSSRRQRATTWSTVVAERTAATGVAGSRPPAISSAAMAPRWATPISTTTVPPTLASDRQSTSGSPARRWPVTTVNAAATPAVGDRDAGGGRARRRPT